MMNTEQARKVLLKYSNGTASDQQRALVESWYARFGEINDPVSAKQLLLDQKDSWEQLLNDYEQVRKIRLWPRIAAAAVILLSLSVGVYYYNHNVTNQKIELASGVSIAPGKNSATLTLSNGKKILLTDAANGMLAEDAGIKITKSANGKIVYELTSLNSATGFQKEMLNTINTPIGGQYQVILPDGTKVYLNAGSSLTYPVVFNSNERKVSLSGEGFFEVAKVYAQNDGTIRSNKRIPFLVTTTSQTVEVLGTQFNISSYEDENVVKTSLVEGRVKVSPHIGNTSAIELIPDQQAILTNYGKLSRVEVDAAEVAAWKDGKFTFSSEPLGAIMKKAERWYGVKVVFKDQVSELKLTGSISRFDNMSSLLKTLEETGEINFFVAGRTVTVSRAR